MCRGLATPPQTSSISAKDIKHKISSLLQKTEPQAADQKQLKTDAAAAANRKPSQAEVKKWKESFSHVMSSQSGRLAFGNFLRSEFSEENMDFWVACEDYKRSSPSKLATRAKELFQQHIEADAPHEVNLDAVTREETRQNLENACPACFNEAQRMIYILMEKDSYRRFIKSKLIQDLSQTVTEEKKSKGKKNCNCAGSSLAFTSEG